MKRILLILFLIIILFGCSKEEKVIPAVHIEIESNKIFEYDEEVYVYDLINDDSIKITSDNIQLDTSVLGEHTVKIDFIKEETRAYDEVTYYVVDTTEPLVLINSTYTYNKGDKDNLVDRILCADNYDKRPNCYIDGNYDFNRIGTYNLKHIAIDSSNNKVENEFTLKIVKPTSSSTSNNKPKYLIEDLIKEHKNDNTLIGIDVSEWQGNINYQKVKDAGVEFVIIRIGFGHNKKGELVVDKQFKNNLKNAKAAGLKVGIYFYSYANTIDKVKEQVKWINDNLEGQTLDLPIAFDWEDWSSFNSYNMSLIDIRLVAKAFISETEKYGYKGMLYSSKYYLEKIWGINKYDTWLAHYTDKTTYTGKYYIWQLSNRGKVNGISGDVDLDILYKENTPNN